MTEWVNEVIIYSFLCGKFGPPHSQSSNSALSGKILSTIFPLILKKKPVSILDTGYLFNVAERMGFEPMVECYPHTRLAGEHLQPARSSLRMVRVAEGVGFEPTEVLPSTVFKTAAFDHSAIPPNFVNRYPTNYGSCGQSFL